MLGEGHFLPHMIAISLSTAGSKVDWSDRVDWNTLSYNGTDGQKPHHIELLCLLQIPHAHVNVGHGEVVDLEHKQERLELVSCPSK